MEHKINNLAWLNNIKTAFLKSSFDVIINVEKSLKQPKNIFIKLLNSSGCQIRPEAFEDDEVDSLKSRYISKIILKNRSRGQTRVAWSNSEKTRLLAGRRIYYNLHGNYKGVWTYISKLSVFGFMFNREVAHMKDAFVRIEKLSEKKRKILYGSASVWDPSHYSFNNIVNDLRKFQISISEDSLEYFEKLHEIDMKTVSGVLHLRDDDLSTDLNNKVLEAPIPVHGSICEMPVYEYLSKLERKIDLLEDHLQIIDSRFTDFMKKDDIPVQDEAHGYSPEFYNNFSVEFDDNNINHQFSGDERPCSPNLLVPEENILSVIQKELVENDPNIITELNNVNIIATDDYKILSENYIMQESSEDILLQVRLKLFEVFRFRGFSSMTAYDVLVNCHNFQFCSLKNFAQLLQELERLFIVCRLNSSEAPVFSEFKFNLKISDVKYLNVNDVIGYIRKTANSNALKIFTIKAVRKNIYLPLRPNSIDWHAYFYDLISDGAVVVYKFNKGKIVYYNIVEHQN